MTYVGFERQMQFVSEAEGRLRLQPGFDTPMEASFSEYKIKLEVVKALATEAAEALGLAIPELIELPNDKKAQILAVLKRVADNLNGIDWDTLEEVPKA